MRAQVEPLPLSHPKRGLANPGEYSRVVAVQIENHIGWRDVEEVKANADPAPFWVEPPKPFDKILLLHFHHDPKGRECGHLTANMPTGAALAMGLQSWPAWFPLAIPRALAFRG